MSTTVYQLSSCYNFTLSPSNCFGIIDQHRQ